MSSRRDHQWPFIVGGGFGLAGIISLGGIVELAPGSYPIKSVIVPVVVGSAAALVGCLWWALLVQRIPQGAYATRTTVAGALAGASGPLAVFVLGSVLLRPVEFANKLVATPVTTISPLVFVGLFGLVFVGWMTIPAGAIMGYVLGRYFRSMQAESGSDCE